MELSKTNINLSALASELANRLNLRIKDNPYTAEISRMAPTAFVFLIDQSQSMENTCHYKGRQTSMADAVADVMNELLNELILTCKRTDGIGDYADVLVIGYGNNQAAVAWQGKLQGKSWVKVSELIDSEYSTKEIEVEVPTRAGTRKELQKLLCWIEAKANGNTPMRRALQLATSELAKWIEQHPENFPPIVFNITDGMPTDGDNAQMLVAAKEIRDLHTSDGHVLLFNIHISHQNGSQVFLPASMDELPNDAYAQNLYRMSSILPKAFEPRIADMVSGGLKAQHVAMSYNADLKNLWRLLQIGTRTTKR